jgi:hypothetical protein
VYLDKISNRTGSELIPPYQNELEFECKKYGKCIVAYKKRWRKVFGSSHVNPGVYPFFFVHERFHQDKPMEKFYGLEFWKRREEKSYKVFHCVSCDQSTDESFIIHTGTASWNRLKDKAMEAFKVVEIS